MNAPLHVKMLHSDTEGVYHYRDFTAKSVEQDGATLTIHHADDSTERLWKAAVPMLKVYWNGN